jgi:ATP-dependent protease ClpP protease subunit
MRNSFYGIRSHQSYSLGRKKKEVSQGQEEAARIVEAAFSGHDGIPVSPFQKDTAIEVDENRIYFYAEVGEREALDLNKIIRHLDIEMDYLRRRLGLSERPPIRLFIHSPGGSFFSALSIIDAILACESPVHTYIDGHAASAATMISICGTKRFATRNSFMLIHQQRMAWEGKHADFIDEIENQKHVTETMKKLYLERTKMSEEELNSILKRELHMPAEDCLRLGLIDEIV